MKNKEYGFYSEGVMLMCRYVRWIKSEAHNGLESETQGEKDSETRGGYVND